MLHKTTGMFFVALQLAGDPLDSRGTAVAQEEEGQSASPTTKPKTEQEVPPALWYNNVAWNFSPKVLCGILAYFFDITSIAFVFCFRFRRNRTCKTCPITTHVTFTQNFPSSLQKEQISKALNSL